MTSTQSRVAQIAAREALLAASGLGSVLGPLQQVGQGLSKLITGGRKNLVSPFAKSIGGGLSLAGRKESKRVREASIAAEQWFNRLVTRPGDPEALQRFVEQAAILRDESPYWYGRLLPEVRSALEAVFAQPIEIAPMAPLINQAAFEIPPPMVSNLIGYSGPTGADTMPGLVATIDGTLLTKPYRSPLLSSGAAASTSNIGSGSPAVDSSAPAESRRTGGALLFLAAVGAALVLLT
jgi:hypothetical protein